MGEEFTLSVTQVILKYCRLKASSYSKSEFPLCVVEINRINEVRNWSLEIESVLKCLACFYLRHYWIRVVISSIYFTN